MFLSMGITVDCKKYGGICEKLVDEDNVMDVRSKGSDSRSIPTGMTPKPDLPRGQEGSSQRSP